MTMVFFEDLFNSLAEYQKKEFIENIIHGEKNFILNELSDEELIDEIRVRQLEPDDVFYEYDIIKSCESLGYTVNG